MKSTVLWGLVGLNALLLFSYIGQFTHSRTADAQMARPADYLLIPGEIPNGNTEIVYVIDTSNGRLGALAYDDSNKVLRSMPQVNLNDLFASAMKQQVR